MNTALQPRIPLIDDQPFKEKGIRGSDMFCGLGGFTEGFKRACEARGLAFSLVAINHCQAAIRTHEANHPDVRTYCESIAEVDPRTAVPSGHLDLLIGSPECFPAGTRILTAQGFCPIEEVNVGDLVCTHKGRWRKVTSTMREHKATQIIRGFGHHGIETTGKHPFLVRRRGRRWNNIRRSYEITLGESEWKPVRELGRDHYWATPTRIEQLPEGYQTAPKGFDLDEAFWWIVGRWLGDGSVSLRPGKGGEITICCGNHQADVLELDLRVGSPLCWSRRNSRTATLFEARNSGLARWLVTHFGDGALRKRLPAWIFGADEAIRRALLNGYVSADGHRSKHKFEITTVSHDLALGIRLLAEGLGHHCAYYCVPQHNHVIEGREVNTHDLHSVKWTAEPKRADHFCDADHGWTRIKEIAPTGEVKEVFNLSVEEDESYIAEGIVVHNCTHFSVARGGKPMDDQSRHGVRHIEHWCDALTVDYVLIENVPEFMTWGPLDDNNRPIKHRKGEFFKAFIQRMQARGYKVEHRILCAADYGDPTTRRRFFAIAQREAAEQLPWPTQTHCDPRKAFENPGLKPWRTAREIIDWSIASKSIFGRKKPLAEKTLRRIEKGLQKFGGPNAEPFLVILRHHMAAIGIDEPLPTICSKGQHVALVEQEWVSASDSSPTLVGEDARRGGGPGSEQVREIVPNSAASFILPHRKFKRMDADSLDAPLRTIDATNGRMIGIVEPYIVNTANTKSTGRGPGAWDTDEPLRTVTSVNGFGVVDPMLIQYHAGEDERNLDRAKTIDEPVGTLDTSNRFGLVEFMVNMKGQSDASSVDNPAPTQTGCGHLYLGECAFLVPNFGEREGQDPRSHSVASPVPAITSHGAGALVEPCIIDVTHGDGKDPNASARRAHSVDAPIGTVTGAKRGEKALAEFVTEYYGTGDANSVEQPLPTVTTKERFAIVEIVLEENQVWLFDGGKNPDFHPKYALIDSEGRVRYWLDIRLRMLRPHELAAAHSIPNYKLIGTLETQVKQIGNMVPAAIAEALIGAILDAIGDRDQQSEPSEEAA